MTPPFIIYALPRSRTAWLSRFLTYRKWTCFHEAAIVMRTMDDVDGFFSRPCTGTAETAAAPGWQLLHHRVAGLRAVVVRRPIDEVVGSMLALDVGGIAVYDEAKLRQIMTYEDRVLKTISEQPGTLSLAYSDLDQEDACATVFERCLPYKFPRDWWLTLRERNVQADAASVLRYYHANRAGVDSFKSACKSEMRALARDGHIGRRRAA